MDNTSLACKCLIQCYSFNTQTWPLCLCVRVSESPPITRSVQAMECDVPLKKNKAPHLPLSLICTWRAAALYDKLTRPNAHKHVRVYTPTHNALGSLPCSRGHCKQLKSICALVYCHSSTPLRTNSFPPAMSVTYGMWYLGFPSCSPISLHRQEHQD